VHCGASRDERGQAQSDYHAMFAANRGSASCLCWVGKWVRHVEASRPPAAAEGSHSQCSCRAAWTADWARQTVSIGRW